jgi:hypothetical protein
MPPVTMGRKSKLQLMRAKLAQAARSVKERDEKHQHELEEIETRESDEDQTFIIEDEEESTEDDWDGCECDDGEPLCEACLATICSHNGYNNSDCSICQQHRAHDRRVAALLLVHGEEVFGSTSAFTKMMV